MFAERQPHRRCVPGSTVLTRPRTRSATTARRWHRPLSRTRRGTPSRLAGLDDAADRAAGLSAGLCARPLALAALCGGRCCSASCVTFLSGGVTRAYAWLVLLGNRGLFNQMLLALGLPPFKLVHNETGVVIGVVHFLLPFFVLTLLGRLARTFRWRSRTQRATSAPAAGAYSCTWRCRCRLPGLIAAASLSFVGALSAFLFPELLGGGRVHMAADLIYERIVTDYNLPRVAAMAALFLILALARARHAGRSCSARSPGASRGHSRPRMSAGVAAPYSRAVVLRGGRHGLRPAPGRVHRPLCIQRHWRT